MLAAAPGTKDFKAASWGASDAYVSSSRKSRFDPRASATLSGSSPCGESQTGSTGTPVGMSARSAAAARNSPQRAYLQLPRPPFS